MKKEQLEDGMARLLLEMEAEDALQAYDDEDLGAWEGLALGTATPEQAEAMRVSAREDDEAARRLAAYRPIDGDARARLLAGVRAELGTSKHRGLRLVPDPAEDEAAADSGDADDEVEPSRGDGSVATPSEAGAPVVAFPKARRGGRPSRWLSNSIAAVAAALLCVVLWPKPPAALPVYELSAESTTRKMRSHGAVDPGALAGEVLALADGDTFEIILRPQRVVAGAVDVVVYARRASGWEKAEMRADVSENGAVRLQGLFDADLRGGSDSLDLWVVVAARGAIPTAAAVHRSGAPTADDESSRWRVLPLTLEQAPGGDL